MARGRTAPFFRTITLGTASDYSDRMGSDRTAPHFVKFRINSYVWQKGTGREVYAEEHFVSLSVNEATKEIPVPTLRSVKQISVFTLNNVKCKHISDFEAESVPVPANRLPHNLTNSHPFSRISH